MYREPIPISTNRVYEGLTGLTIFEAIVREESPDLCYDCVEADGLCYRCRWAVLPRLTRPSWIKLINMVAVEQTERQNTAEEAEQMSARRLAAIRAMRLGAARGRTTQRAAARRRALQGFTGLSPS